MNENSAGQWPDARILEMAIVVVAIVFVALGTYGRSFGDTADSRLATVYSLTQFGTWYIDRPLGEEPITFEQRTIDKVMVNGRMLSSKPPMLPLFMTAEYALMQPVFGWSLDEPEDTESIIRFMSMTLIGGAYILALIYFAATLRLFIEDGWTRAFCLLALAFGTQLWAYGTNINNHVPATGLLVMAVYYAVGLGSGKLDPAPRRFFLFGISGGLAAAMDMPAAIFVLVAGIYLVRKLPRPTLIYTSIGAAIPIVVHSAIMIKVTGGVLPVQTRPELYLYEASYWRNPREMDGLNEPKLVYLFHMTFGRKGLFSLYPVTIFGIVAAIIAAIKKDFPQRTLLLGGMAGFAVLSAYYGLTTNNYGGSAFGFRWYVVAMPILLLMAAPWLQRVRNRWAWLGIAIAMGVSFYSAWQCSVTPWGANNEWTCRFLGPSF